MGSSQLNSDSWSGLRSRQIRGSVIYLEIEDEGAENSTARKTD